MSVSDITIVSTLTEMLEILSKKAPNLRPSIFPTQFCPTSIEQFFVGEDQKRDANMWSSNVPSNSIAFNTEINVSTRTIVIKNLLYVSELDSFLYSLEKVMKMMVMGEEHEITIAITRFLEVNGYSGNIREERHIFNEVYHLAYAIKVLISNMPDVRMYLGSHVLPLDESVDVKELLTGLARNSAKIKTPKAKSSSSSSSSSSTKAVDGATTSKLKTSGNNSNKNSKNNDSKIKVDGDDDSEDDEDDEDDETEVISNNKKKRRKRGKA